jgi:tetratricopeptide (TPR) repeat protein
MIVPGYKPIYLASPTHTTTFIMIKQFFFLLFSLAMTITVAAQQNKIRLPDFELKPPVKDIKRLQLLPSQPPSRAQLVSSLKQSSQQIQKGIPAPRVEEIKQLSATLPVETINDKAIMEFYADDPKGAILMMMETAARAPDSLLVLNNLGAMLNLQGAAEIAIPVLQYCLQKIPGSSAVLNNIGQGFMSLGDALKAAAYFRQCLSVDSLNIEANHSMGMLHYFKKEYDAATEFFERELSVAVRSNTMAMAYRMGKKFNLRAIMQRKSRRNGQPQKDHFEEITMGKFSFPPLPNSVRQLMAERQFNNAYATSVQAEQMAWTNHAIQLSVNYTAASGNQYPGLYTELVNAMLEELHEEFTPEYLYAFTQTDQDHILEVLSQRSDMLIKLKCPDLPEGTGIDAQEAYAIKCCRELMQPVADKMVYEIGSYVQPIIRTGEGRWKAYINQLVEIVQLDPSPGNKALVYHAVAGYFNYLSVAYVSFPVWEVHTLLPKCFEPYDAAELDSLIESDQNWKVSCPPWLNAEVKLSGLVIKADCNKYVIEVGSSMMGAFEHEFKTGNSTILFGPATKAEFLGLTAEFKSQLYITFDGKKQFADFGIKNSAELGLTGTPIPFGPNIRIGGNLAGIEVSNTMSIHGGYNQSMETKGAFAR